MPFACLRGTVTFVPLVDIPLARRGGGGYIGFASAADRGLLDVLTGDTTAFKLMVGCCPVLIDLSLGLESNAGFFGTGGAGFRVMLDVDDATDAMLGEFGS